MRGLAPFPGRIHAGLTRPMLQPGTIPGPPTRAAPMFEVMLPYKLGMTITSNCWGFETNCIELEQSQPRSSNATNDSRVVDDHGVESDTRTLVFLCDGLARVQEETVTELHDVGLVDTGDLLLGGAPVSTYPVSRDCHVPFDHSSMRNQTQTSQFDPPWPAC